MNELLDYLFVRLYYRLFVRPRPAAKAAPEWNINLPGMKAFYKGAAQTHGKNQFAGMSMSFYLTGDGEGGKVLCGALDPIPAKVQSAINTMNKHHRTQFLRRLIEEGDRVFRVAWKQSVKTKPRALSSIFLTNIDNVF